MTKPRISIIIPAYNEEKYLGKTLESVKSAIQAYGDSVEVIVVDNNSSDNTAKIAIAYDAAVVFEKENQIAKAKNKGALSATGKYLIFLDADTLIDKNLIRKADELLSSGKVIGGGAFVDFDKYWDYRLIAKTVNYLLLLIKKSWGAFLFCEKETFHKIGGFDESLYGLEEIALANALKKEGKKLNKQFVIISKYKVVTSARRLKSRWKIIKTRIPMIWGVKRKIRDKDLCRRVWYDGKR